ncbi:MAG: D-amino acid dehydrogenase 1 [Alphaproteobacteria bacterium MarineAlpha5_Bin9]|nr:MAG: D-amino acid dehydrogenase 1 [Alphaproteobacteria bacterium MarineAlpha5_Bin9]
MEKVAVIGSGIIGICSSYFLQKNNFEVTLFDPEKPGSMTSYGHACTFANYGFIPINSPSLFKEIPSMLINSESPLSVNYWYILNNLNWAIKFLRNCRKEKVSYIISSLANLLNHASSSYDEIFNDINVSEYIKNAEVLSLYKDKDEYLNSQHTNNLRKKYGVKIQELSSNEIYELEPNIAQIYYKGVMYKGSRYTTNPLMVSKKIFESFISRGGNYINDKVINIEKNNNKILIKSQNNSGLFDKILIAAGSWSKNLALLVGDKFPLETERGYHLLFNNKDRIINRPVSWPKYGIYFVPLQEGLRAAGTVEIAGLKNGINRKRLKMIEDQSRKLFPQLGEVKSNWIGFRPTLPDSMPIIGESANHKNIFYSFGHQHIGWTLGAISGKIICDIILRKKTNINISPFDPKRFK